jgi:hypothetical protein
MIERIPIPLGAGRLHRDLLVAPLKKESIRSDALSKYGKAPSYPVAGLLNPPPGYKIKSVIAELEKRRAELSARALEAAAKAREAERKRAEAEAVAQAAMEKAQKMESLLLGAEAGDREDAERQLVFGFLVFANGKAEADANGTVENLATRDFNPEGRRRRAFLEFKMLGEELRARLRSMAYGLVIALLMMGVSWLALS